LNVPAFSEPGNARYETGIRPNLGFALSKQPIHSLGEPVAQLFAAAMVGQSADVGRVSRCVNTGAELHEHRRRRSGTKIPSARVPARTLEFYHPAQRANGHPASSPGCTRRPKEKKFPTAEAGINRVDLGHAALRPAPRCRLFRVEVRQAAWCLRGSPRAAHNACAAGNRDAPRQGCLRHPRWERRQTHDVVAKRAILLADLRRGGILRPIGFRRWRHLLHARLIDHLFDEDAHADAAAGRRGFYPCPPIVVEADAEDGGRGRGDNGKVTAPVYTVNRSLGAARRRRL